MSKRKTVVIPESACPHCGVALDRTSQADRAYGRTPVPGNVSLCIRCGEWSVFDEHLRMRVPSDDELYQIGLDAGCRGLREAWAVIHKPQSEGEEP